MTDLLYTIPDFPTKHYTHLLPSLEKNLITTTDLLTLDALDIAKRAHLPLLDVRRLKEHVLATLQGQLGLTSELSSKFEDTGEGKPGYGALSKNGHELVKIGGCISTLDSALDEALGGGVRTGYITEFTGESGAGKTQLLLTLLLSGQLPTSSIPASDPIGLGRPTCYISTEHALPTKRVLQILRTNPILSQSPSPPSMSRILTLQTPDLESQDHILTYQLPIALTRHNVGLIVIDSITANYRAEQTNPAALAMRSTQLVKLGSLLRNLARDHDCAVVVANQVGDRFSSPFHSSSTAPAATNTGTTPIAARPSPLTSGPTTTALFSSSPASVSSHMHTTTSLAPAILSLDHQQRFFTGWGDSPPPPSTYHPSTPSSQFHHHHHHHEQNLKTPSLGLVWANQIACRVALIKEEAYDPTGGVVIRITSSPSPAGTMMEQGQRENQGQDQGQGRTAEWTAKKWRRWMRVVFAPWVGGCGEGDKGVEFEVWAGGVKAVGGVVEKKKEKKKEEEEGARDGS